MTQNPPSLPEGAYPSYVSPRVLAKRAIALLEQRIHQDFGLKVRMGAELEFSILPRQDSLGQNPVEMLEKRKDSVNADDPDYLDVTGYLPANQRRGDRNARIFTGDPAKYGEPTDWTQIEGKRDPLFPDSPYVAYSYAEEHQNEFEAVISHQARHDQLPPDGSRALTFARSIEALRSTMNDCQNPRRRFARTDDGHHQTLQKLAANWKPQFKSISTPFDLSKRTHGMHINLSFTDAQDKPVPALLGNEQALLYGIMPMVNEGMHLLIGDGSAATRFWERGRTVRHYDMRGDKPDQRGKYFEIRTPSASSDPYYAVMLTLAGIYNFLEKGGYDPNTRRLTTPHAIGVDTTYIDTPSPDADPRAYYAERFFNGECRVLTLLDRLEPRLGHRFDVAVSHQPPYAPEKAVHTRG